MKGVELARNEKKHLSYCTVKQKLVRPALASKRKLERWSAGAAVPGGPRSFS